MIAFVALLGVAGAASMLGGISGTSSPSAGSESNVPNEYIARLYTEGLGRLPDQTGWNAQLSRFTGSGCSIQTMTDAAVTTLGSNEFAAIPYTDRARAYAMFRAMLSREPTGDEVTLWAGRIKGSSMSSAVRQLAATQSFAAITMQACTGNMYPVTGSPFALATRTSTASVQARINAAPVGGTVYLPPSQFVVLNERLIVKRGVTLATEGSSGLSGRRAYLNMAHLVRTSDTWTGPNILLMPGAQLRNVWVDGQMWKVKDKISSGNNIQIAPTDSGSAFDVDIEGDPYSDDGTRAPTTVRHVRSDNVRAAQNIMAFDSRKYHALNMEPPPINVEHPLPFSEDNECRGLVKIDGNLVVNSANLHSSSLLWADGIATGCSNTEVTNNEILDASDVALLAYPASGSTPQASKFIGNKVLSAGNSTFGGIVTDPLSSTSQDDRIYPRCLVTSSPRQHNCDYRGFTAVDNTLWTGTNAQFVIAVSAGNAAWGFFQPDSSDAAGGYFARNSNRGSVINVAIPAYVSGLHGATMHDNFTDPGVRTRADRSCRPSATQLVNRARATNLTFSNTSPWTASSSRLVSTTATTIADDCI